LVSDGAVCAEATDEKLSAATPMSAHAVPFVSSGIDRIAGSSVERMFKGTLSVARRIRNRNGAQPSARRTA
jgi:hypothetical protein